MAGKPGLKRFLRVTSSGLLRAGKAKVKTEENLDGKDLNLDGKDLLAVL